MSRWAGSPRFAWLVFVVACMISSGLVVVHWDRVDHSSTWMFEEYGRAILDPLPQNATLLVNGDINNNAVKYLQQCEDVRPDVAILGVQQMTWPWFVDMQAANYAHWGIVFPGSRYHPFFKGGFSMDQFLRANLDRGPMFLCGPWKDGDPSPQQAGWTTLPFGLCSQIFRNQNVPSESENLFHFYQKSFEALPIFPQQSEKLAEHAHRHGLGPWLPLRFTEETWEYVVYRDAWNRLVHLTNVVSFEASRTKDERLLELGKNMTDLTFFGLDPRPPEIAAEKLAGLRCDLRYVDATSPPGPAHGV
eukprot:GABV01000990.1.p1 GENE.GABV01000990.1~~GABV01000990.1.p1  ORF type:complete len:304 (-),score=65.81 GABV01000990.1:96-1007(-)